MDMRFTDPQFHLEMTPGLFEEAVTRARGLLADCGIDAELICQQGQQFLPMLRETASTVFALGRNALLIALHRRM